jgi:hypothetical protein
MDDIIQQFIYLMIEVNEARGFMVAYTFDLAAHILHVTVQTQAT